MLVLHAGCRCGRTLCSKPKYTNELTGYYVSLKKVQMTLGLFIEVVLMGCVGICYCQLVQLKLRGRAYLHSLSCNLL